MPPYRGTSSWICHAPSRQKFLEKDEKKLSSPPKNVLVNLNLKTNVIQFVELQVKVFNF